MASMAPKPPPRGVDLPSDDGEPMETWRHRAQMNLLADSLDDAWRDRHDFYVGANMGVYFSETQARNNDFRAPDVFVVVDVDRRKERRHWVVWEEDGRTPDVVIELTSESTEAVDRGPKMNVYARVLHVATYVLFDPWTKRFDAFQLDPGQRRYRPLEKDERGFVWVEPLGLWLGPWTGAYHDVTTEWLRWYDPQGELLLVDREEAALQMRRAAEHAEHEKRRAEQEAERAEQAARRVEQEAHRAEQAGRRAEQEARRAEQQTQLAERESARADREAARAAALEAELRALRSRRD